MYSKPVQSLKKSFNSKVVWRYLVISFWEKAYEVKII